MPVIDFETREGNCMCRRGPCRAAFLEAKLKQKSRKMGLQRLFFCSKGLGPDFEPIFSRVGTEKRPQHEANLSPKIEGTRAKVKTATSAKMCTAPRREPHFIRSQVYNIQQDTQKKNHENLMTCDMHFGRLLRPIWNPFQGPRWGPKGVQKVVQRHAEAIERLTGADATSTHLETRWTLFRTRHSQWPARGSQGGGPKNEQSWPQ